MICFVFRPKRRVNGKVRVARMWSGKFQLPGDLKVTVVALGVTDKQVALEKLRRLVREREREREGLIQPKAERDVLKWPIQAAIHEYVESRRGLHRGAKYCRDRQLRLSRLAHACGWSTVAEINGYSFETWRAQQKTFCAKTLNEYQAAAAMFCNWLEKRTGRNPMRSVERIKSLGDPRRTRRAFTAEELWRLVDVAGERGIVYLVAAVTGLRRGELSRIEWRDVNLDEPQPYISARSSITKNAKLVGQPLAPKVAAALRQYRPANVVPRDLVLRRLMPTMDRFRADLAAAGISYVDEKGRHADFHALRKTLGTELAKSQQPLRVTMELMRHSDAKLTTKIYTDAGMLPTWDAVQALPMFNDTQTDTQNPDTTVHKLALPGNVPENYSNSLGVEDEESSHSQAHFVTNSPATQEIAARSFESSPAHFLFNGGACALCCAMTSTFDVVLLCLVWRRNAFSTSRLCAPSFFSQKRCELLF
jgi:integrase